jgi:hypothetical protein
MIWEHGPSVSPSPARPPSSRSLCAPHPRAELLGYDRRRVTVDMPNVPFGSGALRCGIGQLDMWSSPPALAGGTRKGELLFAMPKPSKLRRRRVVEVTGTSHKATSFGDPGGTATSDDVTRTTTLTFTRLHR